MCNISLQESQGLKKRDTSLDIIRIVAFLSVVAVHFFLNNGFYHQPVVGKRMYVMVLLRSFFMDCVPLFMILSGYLMNKKKISLRYYIGGLKTVIIYILASICCLVYAMSNDRLPLDEALLKILNFTASPYAWYIEMYLGLFLLIPFLNLIYHGLENKKQKQLLLIILLSITAIPMLTNMAYQLLPDWWITIYPVTYYFIGAYLSEYMPRIKSRYLILMLCVHILCMGSFCYYKSDNAAFKWGTWCAWGSILNTITAVLMFILIKQCCTENWNARLKALLKYISSLCLGAYLVSWIFDNMYYPILSDRVPEMLYRLEYMGIMVPAVAISALLVSVLITFIGNRLMKGILKAVK